MNVSAFSKPRVVSPWQIADAEIAARCEQAFQNGGPRVFTLEDWRLLPSGMSAERTVRCAFSGSTVLARRKSGGRYVWQVREVS